MTMTAIRETVTEGAELPMEPTQLKWAVPEKLNVPPDDLKARLDFYGGSIMLYTMEGCIITAKHVSADDIAAALLGIVNISSGLLPENTLWFTQRNNQNQYGLWRPPQIWHVALETKALEPPERFKIPMPGLVFVCAAGIPPAVYAAKVKPRSRETPLYHAPVFNVYHDGHSCGGTNEYPKEVSSIPESFFMSFFTLHAEYGGRSKSHPDSLYKLWKELDGRKKYPLDDLVPSERKLKDLM